MKKIISNKLPLNKIPSNYYTFSSSTNELTKVVMGNYLFVQKIFYFINNIFIKNI